MALGVDYTRQDCSLARALETVGERWTLLILRDSVFGVRRFTDFQVHLDISKAVLTTRLTSLVDDGLLVKTGEEYLPTDDALALWPALVALTSWAERRSPNGPRRVFTHADCGTDLDAGRCPRCEVSPTPDRVDMRAGPGADPAIRSDMISVALRSPRRLLTPFR
ncbi:ArsR family transcriptional regulator [Rhodococcoides trifolii]|uniref:ArsR family transcriptional regulator n=1 Tax=Rhodococcoides trifolii TaxID=908250 RepID=A0A917FRT6_9NOCA|nr:helix-turn-helix domain-containing protein [Rhodococcus trifolii]GGG00202.1 ArsR family transcriptional regulator [Rhodococcus trifolii]